MLNPNDAYAALTLAIMKCHVVCEEMAIQKLESALSAIEVGEESYLSAAMKLKLPVSHVASCREDAADLLAYIV